MDLLRLRRMEGESPEIFRLCRLRHQFHDPDGGLRGCDTDNIVEEGCVGYPLRHDELSAKNLHLLDAVEGICSDCPG